MTTSKAPTTALERSGVTERVEQSGELMKSAQETEQQTSIMLAGSMAKKFPRNESDAFVRLLKACERPSFAEEARYSFPRGGNSVTGPSVNMAREAKRVWGNIRSGFVIVHETDETRKIGAYAWDIETNTYEYAEDEFQKLIQRRVDGHAKWVVPDERDLRELTNRRGAILERNVTLKLMPRDMIEDAMKRVTQTLQNRVKEDPEKARKDVVTKFASIGVLPSMIEKRIGRPLAQATPEELAELVAIFQSIIDGNSKWSDGEEKDETGASGDQKLDALAKAHDASKHPQQAPKVAQPAAKREAPPAQKPPDPAPEPSKPATPSPAPTTDGISDEVWAEFRIYMDDSADRRQAVKNVKAQQQPPVKYLKDVTDPAVRARIIVAAEAECAKLGVQFGFSIT